MSDGWADEIMQDLRAQNVLDHPWKYELDVQSGVWVDRDHPTWCVSDQRVRRFCDQRALPPTHGSEGGR